MIGNYMRAKIVYCFFVFLIGVMICTNEVKGHGDEDDTTTAQKKVTVSIDDVRGACWYLEACATGRSPGSLKVPLCRYMFFVMRGSPIPLSCVVLSLVAGINKESDKKRKQLQEHISQLSRLECPEEGEFWENVPECALDVAQGLREIWEQERNAEEMKKTRYKSNCSCEGIIL